MKRGEKYLFFNFFFSKMLSFTRPLIWKIYVCMYICISFIYQSPLSLSPPSLSPSPLPPLSLSPHCIPICPGRQKVQEALDLQFTKWQKWKTCFKSFITIRLFQSKRNNILEIKLYGIHYRLFEWFIIKINMYFCPWVNNPSLPIVSEKDLYEEIFHKFVPFALFSSVSPLAHNNTIFCDTECTSCYEIEVIPTSSNCDYALLFTYTHFSMYKLKTFFLNYCQN